MLQNDFYTITNLDTAQPGSVHASISLNADHAIFKGHFPGLPVVPGVCMLAIVKEIVSSCTGKTLVLQNAANIKFLSLINPLEHPNADVTIKFSENKELLLQVDAVISSGDITFFKLVKAIYR